MVFVGAELPHRPTPSSNPIPEEVARTIDQPKIAVDVEERTIRKPTVVSQSSATSHRVIESPHSLQFLEQCLLMLSRSLMMYVRQGAITYRDAGDVLR